MATFSPGHTAKIYAFPPRGRMAGGVVNRPSSAQDLSDELAQMPVTICTGAWYHDEAITSSQAPKRTS